MAHLASVTPIDASPPPIHTRLDKCVLPAERSRAQASPRDPPLEASRRSLEGAPGQLRRSRAKLRRVEGSGRRVPFTRTGSLEAAGDPASYERCSHRSLTRVLALYRDQRDGLSKDP